MASKKGPPEITMPSEKDLETLPEKERLAQATQASTAAANATSLVDKLRSKASLLTDPQQRQRVLTQAFNHEIEARGLSKKARILRSGTFQGAAGGAGIGAATGVGVGTAVGTLVGTVTSVPTTLVGGLVGAGAGAIRGPWIKLPGGDGGKEGEDVQVPQEVVDSGAVQIDEKLGQATVKDPEALKAAVAADKAGKAAGAEKEKEKANGKAGERKKPKKLEVRSGKQSKTEAETNGGAASKRKPPKLAPRSKKSE